MSVSQPLATDLLNAPSHSLLHRIIAADVAAPIQSLVVASDGRVGLRDQTAGVLPTWFTYFKTGTQAQDLLYILPTTPASAGNFLKNDGSGNLSWAAGNNMTVGNGIVGGGANRILFEDASQNLATNANFTYDQVNNIFTAGSSSTNNGINSGVFGTSTTNSGANSFVTGSGNGNTNSSGTVIGEQNTNNGYAGFVSGSHNLIETNAAYSATFNYGNDVQGQYNFVAGYTIVSTANYITAFGKNYTNSTINTFTVGFGQIDFQVASGAISLNGDTTFADAKNLVFNTTTGSKIGTATNQKFAFYNSTPIVQPTGDILTALGALGLVASATLTAADITLGLLAVARGGTGLGSYTTGDILQATASGTIGGLAAVASGSLLSSNGTSTVAVWSSSPTLTTSLTCPIIIGGTTTTSTLTLRGTSGSAANTAAIIFQIDSGKEVARAIYNGTFNLFGIGKTPTAFLDVLGAAPGIVAGTGTTATATFVVVGAPGGATSGTSSPTGGIGGLISEIAGVGGSIPNSSVTGTGVCGAGGAGTWRAGNGGAVNGSSSGLVKGGPGGIGTYGGGDGGVAQQSTNACTGGNGTAGNFIGGSGGAATSGGAGTAIGGDGAAAILQGGSGAQGQSSSGTATGGNGAGAQVIGGNGGSGSTTNGNAGGVIIAMGTTGGGAGSAGTGSSITFKSAVNTSLVVCGTIDKNGRWAIGGTNVNPTGLIHLAAGSATASTGPLKFTSGALLTAAEAGVVEFLTDAYYCTTTTGTIRRMIVAGNTGRSVGATAAVASVAAYTLGAADATFEVSANVLVTTATIHNFTVTVAYTDEGNTARTLTLQFSNLAGTLSTAIANAAGTVPYEGVPLHIRCKASTSITIATTGTFTTVTYNVEGVIKQMA